jgi:signal transduction histidine kinase
MDFKFFFDHSKDALFLIDRSGKINSSNLVSQKHHLTEGKDLFSLLVPSERDKVTETVHNLIDKNSNETVLIELSCFPEMLSRSRWKITFIPELNQTAFCCEELSQYSPEDFLLHTGLMKIIFDNDPNLIAIINRVGQYLFANKAIYEFANIQTPHNIEVLNRMLEDKELWLPGSEETSEASELKISEIELTTDPAGNATWFENIKVPIKMTFGEEVTLIISKNVTNWKMSEKRLVDHQQALFHSNRLSYLGEMAGQIAHEINNPLTIILGNSQIMKKSIKGEVSEENEMLLKSIQKIEFMVERITKLIKMMRTLSKQNNILPQSKSKVFDLVSSVISTLNDKFNAYEIEITTNTNNLERTEILCYPTEISQVILNILLNSIDAIILSKRTEARKISVNLEQKKNEILIKITNNGDEISKEIADRVFEPFFTTKPVGHGTGLGLSISKRIIEQHQGNISFESSIEKTTFIITLPISD